MAEPDVPPPPARFRRRLLAVTLAAGLVPLLLLGVLAHHALERLLSVSVAPVEAVLDEVSAQLERQGLPRAPLDEARLNLAQAELARAALVRRVPVFIAVLVCVAAAVLTAAALVLGRAVTRPVSTLSRGMWAYARGELGVQLPTPEPPRDELEYLLTHFNRMGRELLAQRERLKAAEQVAAWQDVARALAHELKNPLTAMKLSLARLSRTEGPPDAARVAECVALLQEEVDLLMRMTQSFSTFARLPAPRFQPVALRPLLAEVCTLYSGSSPVPVELTQGDGAEPSLAADPDGLRRLFGNLVKNAAEASPAGAPPVRVSLEALGARVRVTVRDGGGGIPGTLEGADLTRGLFSTKPGGSGLGLPIAQKIAHEHGGALRLEPAPGGGTLALVDLPLAPP
ncbi:ATP-binding protein [Myxococcaceae bacterium GXIMD 01537]